MSTSDFSVKSKRQLKLAPYIENPMGTFYSKGYMRKIDKGFYSPTEDDQAPVPKRYTFDGDGEYDQDSHEADVDIEATLENSIYDAWASGVFGYRVG